MEPTAHLGLGHHQPPLLGVRHQRPQVLGLASRHQGHQMRIKLK